MLAYEKLIPTDILQLLSLNPFRKLFGNALLALGSLVSRCLLRVFGPVLKRVVIDLFDRNNDFDLAMQIIHLIFHILNRVHHLSLLSLNS